MSSLGFRDCWDFQLDIQNGSSAFNLVVNAKKNRVLLDSITSLQSHGIYACAPILGTRPMIHQSPYFSILNQFISITVPQMAPTTTSRDVQHHNSPKGSSDNSAITSTDTRETFWAFPLQKVPKIYADWWLSCTQQCTYTWPLPSPTFMISL